MSRRNWSISRLMTIIAVLAFGIASVQALAPRPTQMNPGVIAIVLALTAGADRTLFGQRRRAFWLGFIVMGWFVLAAALSYHQETRQFIMKYGPAILQARDDYMRQIVAVEEARFRGVVRIRPQVRQEYLLLSSIAESVSYFALEVIAASAGGFIATLAAFIAQQAERRYGS